MAFQDLPALLFRFKSLPDHLKNALFLSGKHVAVLASGGKKPGSRRPAGRRTEAGERVMGYHGSSMRMPPI
jgi:hypothetical protein